MVPGAGRGFGIPEGKMLPNGEKERFGMLFYLEEEQYCQKCELRDVGLGPLRARGSDGRRSREEDPVAEVIDGH